MGTRFSANTYEPTTLQFSLFKNGVATSAHAVNKVTIHASLEDADDDKNIIETITTITNTSTGVYQYTASIISTVGTYYDKIFLTPESAMGETSFINSFEVSSFTGYTGDIPNNPGTCTLFGYILDGHGNGLPDVLILASPANVPATLEGGNKLVSSAICETATTSEGYFEFTLMCNVEFIITIREIGYKERLLIPNQSSAQLWSLSPVSAVDSTPNDSNENTW